MKRTLLLLALACLPVAAEEKAPPALSIDLIMRGPQFSGYEPRDVRWSPDSQRVWFRWKQHDEPFEKEWSTWVCDRQGKGLRRLTDEEAKDAPPLRAAWTRDRKRAVYIDGGDVVIWDGRHRNLTNTIEPESSPRFTRDERHVAFVRGNNLFVLSLDDGALVQMTNVIAADDKQPLWDEKKGTPSQEVVKAEERKLLDVVARRAAKREEDEAKRKREHPLQPFKLEKKQTVSDMQLTPDGRYVLASLSSDVDKARKTIVPNYVTESGYVEDINSREKVGDAATVTKLASLSTADGGVKWFSSGLPPAEAAKESGRTSEKQAERRAERTEKEDRDSAVAPKERDVTSGPVLFYEDGSKAVVSLRSRDNKDWWLLAFDPASAKGRVLASVHDDAWVRRMQRSVGFLPDGATVWFLSEASGWAHLWTVPFGGGAARQVTSGKWEVDDVSLSDDRKSLYLTTSAESLYERHLYLLSLPLKSAANATEKLTTGAGRHDAVVSPDGKSIADVWSYTNVPPEVYVGPLHAAAARPNAIDNGAARVTDSPAREFHDFVWVDAPIVTYRATDGVEVPARIYKPADWKSGGPAVVFVHGAGYLQNVHRWWSDYSREYMFHHYLMQHGYLVFDADYRGSAGHGRDWRTAIYRHMGGRDLADEVDAARLLEREYGADSERLGIYGGSYGGFMTLMAMFTAPSVFNAGAALRPVTDWAHYNHPYTSDILNTPQSDPEAYRKSSPIYFAEGLRGHLLICHGVADTNVHFEDTVRLVQKLIELHAQNWDLAIYPVEDHSFVEPSSWSDEYKRIFRLFESTIGRR